MNARRPPLRRPGSLRATVLAAVAISGGAATAIFGGLAAQLANGGDPGLGTGDPAAPASQSVQPTTAPQVAQPTPVTTRVS